MRWQYGQAIANANLQGVQLAHRERETKSDPLYAYVRLINEQTCLFAV